MTLIKGLSRLVQLAGLGVATTQWQREVSTESLRLEKEDDQPVYFLSLITRSTSRPASRALMDSRRSCCFFPFANPSSTLA